MSNGTIVLIHGLWMTPHSWQPWIDRFTAAGYEVVAPAWPGVSELDEPLDHDKAPSDISVVEVADHYEKIIRNLPDQPIIIGHSFGGLVAQILLDRGLGRAVVAVDPAQPRGVWRLPFAVLRATFPVLGNPANISKAVPLTEKQFHYAFASSGTFENAAAVRARLAIPTPGRPLFQAAFANFTPKGRAATYVNWRNNNRAPLLIIGGGADHLVPASVSRENFRRYKHSTAVTEYQEFPGRDHYTAGAPGWEAVADFALEWAAKR